MDRLRRVLTGGTVVMGLGTILLAGGCRSLRNEVPQGKPYSTTGGTPPALGFNQDESKRMVFDGVNDNIAVRQLAMNFRFAIPGGLANLYEAGSDGERPREKPSYASASSVQRRWIDQPSRRMWWKLHASIHRSR